MSDITWVGHATTLVRLGATSVLTDPLLRDRFAHIKRHGAPARIDPHAIDAVLLSHLHHDHADAPSLRRVARSAPTFVPEGAGATVRRLGASDVHEVVVGETVELADGVAVTAMPAVHDGRRLPFTRPADAIGWMIDGAVRVYFAGDTDVFDGMSSLDGRVDVALLPIWGWGPTIGPGHMGPREAAEATALIRPRTVIPIHWGTFLPIGLGRRHRGVLSAPAREFTAACAELAPDVELVVLQPGESVAI